MDIILACLLALSPGEYSQCTMNGLGLDIWQDTKNPSSVQTDFATKAHYDGEYIYFIGQQHDTNNDTQRFIRSTSDGFEVLPQPPCTPGHNYNHTTIDENGVLYCRGYFSTTFWKYDGTWTQLPSTGLSSYKVPASAIEYFPGVGLIYFDYYSGVSTFNGTSWSLFDFDSNYGIFESTNHPFATYLPNQNVVLFGGGDNRTSIWMMDSQGNVTQRNDSPLPFGVSNKAIVLADPSGSALAIAADGNIYQHDFTNDIWNNIGSHPFFDNTQHVVAVPVNDGIFILVGTPQGPQAWVYKPTQGVISPPVEPPPEEEETPPPAGDGSLPVFVDAGGLSSNFKDRDNLLADAGYATPYDANTTNDVGLEYGLTGEQSVTFALHGYDSYGDGNYRVYLRYSNDDFQTYAELTIKQGNLGPDGSIHTVDAGVISLDNLKVRLFVEADSYPNEIRIYTLKIE